VLLEAKNISLGFGESLVIKDLSFKVEKGKVISILGPNGSGKSTVLKGLAKTQTFYMGSVYLDGKNIQLINSKKLARQLAMLIQSPQAPSDLTVRELVEYGRFPHQEWWSGRSEDDKKLVEWALEQTGLALLADRPVETLSGGERQRAWIAMVMAQNPQVLLLDEPTTYLDIAHQLEILNLVTELNATQKVTVVMVLHDINHAARYSDYMAVLNKGELYSFGTPQQVLTTTMLREVFGVNGGIWANEEGQPQCTIYGLVQSKDNLMSRER